MHKIQKLQWRIDDRYGIYPHFGMFAAATMMTTVAAAAAATTKAGVATAASSQINPTPTTTLRPSTRRFNANVRNSTKARGT